MSTPEFNSRSILCIKCGVQDASEILKICIDCLPEDYDYTIRYNIPPKDEFDFWDRQSYILQSALEWGMSAEHGINRYGPHEEYHDKLLELQSWKQQLQYCNIRRNGWPVNIQKSERLEKCIKGTEKSIDLLNVIFDKISDQLPIYELVPSVISIVYEDDKIKITKEEKNYKKNIRRKLN